MIQLELLWSTFLQVDIVGISGNSSFLTLQDKKKKKNKKKAVEASVSQQ